jgi:hypothetical protein
MKNNYCPLIKKECIQNKCAWYTHIRGINPNTGQEVDEWNCTISWIPMLLIENSQQQRSTGAAVESFRNEMVKANESNLNILEAAANMFYGASEAVEEIRFFEESQQNLIENNEEDQNLLNPEGGN